MMNTSLQRRGRHRSPGRTAAAVMAAAAALAAGSASAQSAGYADDFSRDSLRYSFEAATFGGSAGNGTATLVEDGVLLAVDAPADANDYLFLGTDDPGDAFSARVTMNSIAGPIDGQGGIWLEGYLYNDTADFGGEEFSDAGNVFATVTLDFFGDGGRLASLCLQVDGENDSMPFPGFGEEGNNCEGFDELLPDLGTEYTLSLALDREASTLTASVGEASKVVQIETPIFASSRQQRNLQLVRFGEGTATATVHGISTERFDDDFRAEPIVFGPYQVSNDPTGQEGTVSIVDGRARFDVASDGDSYRQATLRFADPLPDYLEAEISVSSESALSTGGRVGTRLQGRLYNDTAAGGFNDREGDVYASVELTFRGNGGREAQYCMNRNNDADGESALPLLDAEDDCLNFGFLPELDTAYLARLALDREAGTVTFAIGDEVRVHDIATPILEAGNGYREIVLFADDDSVGVSHADDLRTSSDAMTAEEIAAANAPVDGADPMDSGTDDGTAPDATEDASDTGDTGDTGIVPDATPTPSAGGSGSGGGCSIDGERGDGLLWLLALLAVATLGLRGRHGTGRRLDAR